MIRVIEATPGSGKTCLVVEWLLREIERGFYGEYYANIEGLKVTGVRPLPDDWRDVNPDKSPDEKPKLLIIDEAQYLEPFMKENRSKNPIGKALSTHRHYGIDIWFITQNVNLLNDYVLSNCGEHVYLYRARKKQSVKVFWWSSIQKTKSATALKQADDQQVWRLNPNIFQYYVSTANVTDAKKRVSQKNVSAILTFLFVMCVIAYMVYKGYSAFTESREQSAPPSQKETFDSVPVEPANKAPGLNIVKTDDEAFSSLSPEPVNDGSDYNVSPPPTAPQVQPRPMTTIEPPTAPYSQPVANPEPISIDTIPVESDSMTPIERRKYRGGFVNVSSPNVNSSSPGGDVFGEKTYSKRLKQLPDQSYLLSKNTVIPCVLDTAIDSTINGRVSCHVPKDVYSSDGSRVLIRRGSVAIGVQDVQLRYGQARVSVLWNEIRTPKGLVIEIDSPAVDSIGKAGLNAKVNNHFMKRLGNAVLFSAVSDGFEYIGNKTGVDAVSRTAGGVVNKSISESVNIAPTAVINQGSIINIMSAHDIDFRPYFESKST